MSAIALHRLTLPMAAPAPSVTVRPFGRHEDALVRSFELRSGTGVTVTAVEYGATVVSILAADSAGREEEVTLCSRGMDELARNPFYYGCIAGRVCNRIAGGTFELDGSRYALATNNGPNHLHGGARGFDKRIWHGTCDCTAEDAIVRFCYTSEHLEEGYPGRVDCEVEYRLSTAGSLRILMAATPSHPTPVALTSHIYFNLSGKPGSSVAEHRLQVAADEYLPVDDTQIPLGHLAPVEGTPFDFRAERLIGGTIDAVDGGGRPGFDHCYALARKDATQAAVLTDPGSGRRLTVSTTLPGLQVRSCNVFSFTRRSSSFCPPPPHQFYTGNWLEVPHSALCLEAQHFPNAINTPAFPSPLATPDSPFVHEIRLEFSTA